MSLLFFSSALSSSVLRRFLPSSTISSLSTIVFVRLLLSCLASSRLFSAFIVFCFLFHVLLLAYKIIIMNNIIIITRPSLHGHGLLFFSHLFLCPNGLTLTRRTKQPKKGTGFRNLESIVWVSNSGCTFPQNHQCRLLNVFAVPSLRIRIRIKSEILMPDKLQARGVR